jgi:WD40 repeat protein
VCSRNGYANFRIGLISLIQPFEPAATGTDEANSQYNGVTADFDTIARLWDLQTGSLVRQFKGHTDFIYGVAFSPDGKWLLTASQDKTAKLWDVQTGEELRSFLGHTNTLFSAVFSHDGKYVLTSSEDKTARLWDVQTGEELRRFAGHTAGVAWADFSPDDKYVVTASEDGTARLCYIAPLQACEWAAPQVCDVGRSSPGMSVGPLNAYASGCPIDELTRQSDTTSASNAQNNMLGLSPMITTSVIPNTKYASKLAASPAAIIRSWGFVVSP